MEYTIVTAASSDELISVVCDQIANGWEPQGGPLAVDYESAEDRQWMFFQAMTRTAESFIRSR